MLSNHSFCARDPASASPRVAKQSAFLTQCFKRPEQYLLRTEKSKASYHFSSRGRNQRGCLRRTAPAKQAPSGPERSPRPCKSAPPCGGGSARQLHARRRKWYCVAESCRSWRHQSRSRSPRFRLPECSIDSLVQFVAVRATPKVRPL
jgi:hypothetical protein